MSTLVQRGSNPIHPQIMESQISGKVPKPETVKKGKKHKSQPRPALYDPPISNLYWNPQSCYSQQQKPFWELQSERKRPQSAIVQSTYSSAFKTLTPRSATHTSVERDYRNSTEEKSTTERKYLRRGKDVELTTKITEQQITIDGNNKTFTRISLTRAEKAMHRLYQQRSQLDSWDIPMYSSFHVVRMQMQAQRLFERNANKPRDDPNSDDLFGCPDTWDEGFDPERYFCRFTSTIPEAKKPSLQNMPQHNHETQQHPEIETLEQTPVDVYRQCEYGDVDTQIGNYETPTLSRPSSALRRTDSGIRNTSVQRGSQSPALTEYTPRETSARSIRTPTPTSVPVHSARSTVSLSTDRLTSESSHVTDESSKTRRNSSSLKPKNKSNERPTAVQIMGSTSVLVRTGGFGATKENVPLGKRTKVRASHKSGGKQ